MNILKSKRFVVRKSLIGKNQVIEFVNKKQLDKHENVYAKTGKTGGARLKHSTFVYTVAGL